MALRVGDVAQAMARGTRVRDEFLGVAIGQLHRRAILHLFLRLRRQNQE
jgi:hypothetical protein